MKVTPEIRQRLSRAKTLNSGAPLNDSKVTLALYSPHIDVAKLTSLLGCAPTHAVLKGQVRHPPHGSGPAPVGHWFLEAPKSLSFEAKILYLLKATPSNTALWRRIAKSHDVQLRCAVFLHAWNEGFDLPIETVAAIGARRWKFGVAIYSAEGDEIVEAFLANAPRSRGR